MSDFLTRYMKKKQIPGVALLVRKDGNVVRSEGFGFANLEHGVPVKPATVFQSGSVGKQFTATAVMILVEEGKLSVDDPVGKYLKVPKTWRRMKIRHLLTNTSGLGDYPEDFDFRKDYTEDEMLKIITKQKLAFSPGANWKYSNLAYVTLGILIHQVSDKFYGDFLKERVFAPLGMSSTRIITEADIIPNRAGGYRLVKGKIKNQEWVSAVVNTTADGSLYFTIEDLAAWDAALESESLLKRESLEQMYTPVVLNDGSKKPYGFGWRIFTTKNGHKLLEHGGAWQGFATHIARYPEDRITVVVLSNLAGTDTGYIAHRVAGFYRPELGPEKHIARAIAPQILKSYEGRYRLSDETLKITATGDRLVTEFRGQPVEMIPESETAFFEEDSVRTFVFEKNTKGKVTSLIVRTPTELRYNRID